MNKSKVLIVFLFTSMVLVTSGQVFAQDSTTGSTGTTRSKSSEEIDAYKAELRAQKTEEIEARKAELQAEKDARTTQRESERAERESDRLAAMAERIAQFADNLAEKVLRYYERLSELSVKLQGKITEFAEQGVDVSVAQTKLDAADALLEQAYIDALALVEEIRSSEVTDTESLGQIISLVREMKNPFREVLAAYKEVAHELRAAVEAFRESTAESAEGEE